MSTVYIIQLTLSIHVKGGNFLFGWILDLEKINTRLLNSQVEICLIIKNFQQLNGNFILKQFS